MAKGDKKTKFCCKDCGYETPKWAGVCFGCQAFGTLEEETYFTGKSAKGVKQIINDGNRKALTFAEVTEHDFDRLETGIGELDRVLGSGMVPGSMVLISAEPGTGKSTLLTSLADIVSRKYGKVVYFSGEESEKQIKVRAERLGIDLTNPNVKLLHTKDMDVVDEVVEEENPVFIIIDSIQTLADPNANGEPGSPTQVKICTGRLGTIAKGKGVTTFIVGQVTKDNNIAGPKLLEHMVDTVLYLEGERYNDLRLLRAKKNRFGSANELGVFQMQEEGLVEVKNPSEFLLSNRANGESGSTVVCISDTRPLLIEVQALTTPVVVEGVSPRRTSEGFSRNRLSILLAVLEKKNKVALSYKDVFVNIVGGMEVDEPGADLGVAMALYSSEKNIPVDPQTLIIGEVGLTGEVRPVGQIEQLINEAEKVGFKECILPEKNYDRVKGKAKKIKLHPVKSVQNAIDILFPSKPKK